MKIALCLIIKNENEYLGEWLHHHKQLGIDHFYIYDNQSDVPVSEYLLKSGILPTANIDVLVWEDNAIGSQMRAYVDCARKNQDYNYIGFLDTDEFYMSRSMDIKRDFWDIEKVYGKNDALGFYWRLYGKQEPYFEERQPIEAYTEYHENGHIKSFVRPNSIIHFPDPHKANIEGRYINELGEPIERPVGHHTSKNIWIKHIYARSLAEWKEKIARGSGDKVNRNKTIEEFYSYNNQCVLND